MITLRCTQKLARRLTLTPDADRQAPTNKLGDWYANALNLGHRRLVVCVSEKTLLSVVLPARDLRGLPSRLPEAIGSLLGRLGVPAPIVEAEIAAMRPVSVGLTRSRSVVGSMVELGREAAFLLAPPVPRPPVADVELVLAGVPCLHLKPYIFPFLAAGGLLGIEIADPEPRRFAQRAAVPEGRVEPRIVIRDHRR